MGRLGVSPRLAKAVLVADGAGVPELGCLVAALLSERDVLHRPPEQSSTNAHGAALLPRLGAVLGRRSAGGVNGQAVRRVLAIARQLLQQLRESNSDGTSTDAEAFDHGPVPEAVPGSPLHSADQDASSVCAPAEYGAGNGNGALESASAAPAGPLDAMSPETAEEEAHDASDASGSTDVLLEETARGWVPAAFTDEQLEEVVGLLVAAAYPDRVAFLRERGNRDRDAYTLSNGASARFASARDPLAAHKLLAVAQVGGQGSGARNDAIRLATPLSLPVLERHLPELITTTEVVEWASSSGQLVGRRKRCLGTVQVSEEIMPVTDEAATTALLNAVRANGLRFLPLPPAFFQLRARLDFLRSGVNTWWPAAREGKAQQKGPAESRVPRKPRRPRRAPAASEGIDALVAGTAGTSQNGIGGTGTSSEGPAGGASVTESLVKACDGPQSGLPQDAGMLVELPDLSDAQLLDRLDQWMGPFLGSVRTKEDLRDLNWQAIIGGLLSVEQARYVEEAAPLDWSAPWGKVEIEYGRGSVTCTLALEEVLGTVENPPDLPERLRGRVKLLVTGPDRAVLAEMPDLSTFWRVHYPKLRGQLSRKYRTLCWPDVT